MIREGKAVIRGEKIPGGFLEQLGWKDKAFEHCWEQMQKPRHSQMGVKRWLFRGLSPVPAHPYLLPRHISLPCTPTHHSPTHLAAP